MKQQINDDFKITKLTQVGLVVRDVEEVAYNYWNILGVGPWKIVTISPPHFRDQVYKGKPIRYSVKVGFTQMGQVELEILQPIDSHTMYDDFLEKHGEGAHHVQYLTDSIDEIFRHNKIMGDKGFPRMQGGRVGNNGGFAYYDTQETFKTVWESVKNPDDFTVLGPSIEYPPDLPVTSPANVKVSEICQVSLAVKNLEKTIHDYWEHLGIGPWEILNCVRPDWFDSTYYGKSTELITKAGLTMMGTVEFELVEPVKGNCLQRDYVDKHGEGVHHLTFSVDDIDRVVDLMEAAGFPCIQYGKIVPDGAYAYFDTIELLKIYWKAFKAPSKPMPIGARYPEKFRTVKKL